MTRPRHVLFTGGGSAGHVVPNLPLIAHFAAAGSAISYVGSKEGPEAGLIAPLGVPFYAIRSGKLRRYWSWRNVADLWWIVVGIAQALLLVRRLRPSVVFSKGGYAAFPIVVAAWVWRVPVVAHESDLTPGLANRLSLPFVAAVCTTFAVTEFPSRRPIVHTGTPLRPELMRGDARRARARFELPTDRPLVVVFGGSLGADALNSVVRDALDALLAFGTVVHVCGPGRTDAAFDGRRGYLQFEFIGADWGDLLAAADVVVARAGANSLYELVALRKPHLLVPLPLSASRGDQIANAAYAVQHGWSRVIAEEELDAARLDTAVRAIYAERERIVAALAGAGLGDGTRAVADVIERYATAD
ncbi:MAG TPA: undecaprenyldiphospho-muramoylpentapeptide beta-N-acetylglucosaminyltransferase [Pseudomonadales bacterium]|nr:undecaprenyldiphospho-muramoylpentapeptide beta-N-acetylglucosaminyltransferase [Pseudomonadales bacterium]